MNSRYKKTESNKAFGFNFGYLELTRKDVLTT